MSSKSTSAIFTHAGSTFEPTSSFPGRSWPTGSGSGGMKQVPAIWHVRTFQPVHAIEHPFSGPLSAPKSHCSVPSTMPLPQTCVDVRQPNTSRRRLLTPVSSLPQPCCDEVPDGWPDMTRTSIGSETNVSPGTVCSNMPNGRLGKSAGVAYRAPLHR
eukprot:3391811-Prymnesium_polylepis.2